MERITVYLAAEPDEADEVAEAIGRLLADRGYGFVTEEDPADAIVVVAEDPYTGSLEGLVDLMTPLRKLLIVKRREA